jgi:hypothetical protein
MDKQVRRRAATIGLCAAALVGASSTTAAAGEITGNGKLKGSKGASHCSFSGQNDGFHIAALSDGPEDAATRVQSYGQIVRHAGSLGGLPGMFCNPTVPPPPE